MNDIDGEGVATFDLTGDDAAYAVDDMLVGQDFENDVEGKSPILSDQEKDEGSVSPPPMVGDAQGNDEWVVLPATAVEAEEVEEKESPEKKKKKKKAAAEAGKKKEKKVAVVKKEKKEKKKAEAPKEKKARRTKSIVAASIIAKLLKEKVGEDQSDADVARVCQDVCSKVSSAMYMAQVMSGKKKLQAKHVEKYAIAPLALVV